MSMTASQIVAKACKIAKCPGYIIDGGQELNLALGDLVMHRNLKVNLVKESISVSAYNFGPFSLASGYLRTYDLFFKDALSAQTYFLEPCSMRQYDNENMSLGVGAFPYEWATDLSPVASGGVGLMYIYPASNVKITLTHRYYLDQPDIASPESSATVPWFEDSDYLVMATAARLMRITDDDRRPAFIMECEQMIKQHLMTEGDEQQVVKEVRLDPRRFRVNGTLKPTKQDPW
jgi:hypothetical protein